MERAIKDRANRKAPGPDNIPIELFKNDGELAIKFMHQLCVTTWKTGEWSEDWTDS